MQLSAKTGTEGGSGNVGLGATSPFSDIEKYI
jgi:hypothetical protein